MLRRLDPWVRCDVSPHMAHNMDCGSRLPLSWREPCWRE